MSILYLKLFTRLIPILLLTKAKVLLRLQDHNLAPAYPSIVTFSHSLIPLL